MINKKPLELYLHIPFCAKKCLYCDFLSAPADAETMHAYMLALEEEIRYRGTEFGDYIVVSVFVGGGTPSIVEASDMEAVFSCIRECFLVALDAEITVEINPGTVDLSKLTAYRSAGVNRLSIGLQSARDEELMRIGRIHNWQQFVDSYENAVLAGFENINVDIMSTLPGQSPEQYLETLHKVLELRPVVKHISAYSLIVEEGTVMYERIQSGEWQEPDEELDRLMYEKTKQVLGQAGYERYEISNYAIPGYECMHNCGYWQRRDYIGFGIGAASLVDNVRFGNGEDLHRYIQEPTRCRGVEQVLSKKEQMEEFMFLGLRMVEGVSEKQFRETFGVTMDSIYASVLEEERREGLLSFYEKNGDGYYGLTEKGLDLSNYCMQKFLLT